MSALEVSESFRRKVAVEGLRRADWQLPVRFFEDN